MTESFHIDLNEFSSKKKKLLKNLLWAALICIVLFILSFFIILIVDSSFEWMPLVSILYIVLYFYFAWLSFKAKLFVKANNYQFEYKFGLLKRDRNIIIWDSVDKVKIGPAYIAFYKKSGKRQVIQLGWLPYAKVIEVKNFLTSIVQLKRIPLEFGEIIRYDTKKKKDKKSH